MVSSSSAPDLPDCSDPAATGSLLRLGETRSRGSCSIARVEKATTWRCMCTLWKTAAAESPSAASPGRAGVSLTRRRLLPDVVRCGSAFDVRADSRSAGNAELTLVAPTHVWLLIAGSMPAQRTAVLSAPIATCASSRRAVCGRLRSCRRCARAVGTDRDCCFTQVKRQLWADGSSDRWSSFGRTVSMLMTDSLALVPERTGSRLPG